MCEEINDILYEAVRKYVEPPNPIIMKTYTQERQERPLVGLSERVDDEDSEEDTEIKENQFTLFNAYRQKDLIFIKSKQSNNSRNGITFYSSQFFQKYQNNTFSYQGHLIEKDIQFKSNFQGANLFAVFKISEDQYDLVMQNDSNTGGYTQWFNFIISNRKRTGTIKLRIINFYKKQALFNEGMKPLSKSLVFDKNWKRSCYNVEYFTNQIQMQGRRLKQYKTLSFKYDFIFENDSVQFSYTYPYTYDNLINFLKQLDDSKLRIKYLGVTPLKKIVTMIRVSSESGQKTQRKAIVLLARQHAGETSSSFIIQDLIQELKTHTQENQFLLSKYNFYIFPMVNVDGVTLGNYRCNLYGYDLNRNWHRQQSKFLPQINYIKNQLIKIMKKEPIELILDLHGHSTKMNSFFYGNNFGKYNMLFPYITSKLQPLIHFGSCSFTDEQNQKSKTARVVLGNMIKETGSVYTYQVSLFGGYKNGKKQPFFRQNFTQLAKSLVLGLYKTFLQIYKEENAMKETAYLKEIRRQIKKIVPKLAKEQAGSDDQAKRTTKIQEKAKSKDKCIKIKLNNAQILQNAVSQDQIMIDDQQQTDYQFAQDQYCVYNKIPAPIKKKNYKSFFQSKATNSRENYSFSLGKIQGVQSSRKNYLMNKLRIFGETFVQDVTTVKGKPFQPINSQAQTNLIYRRLKQQKMAQYQNKSFYYKKQPCLQPLYGSPLTNRKVAKSKRQFRLSKSNTTKIGANFAQFQGLLNYSKLALF